MLLNSVLTMAAALAATSTDGELVTYVWPGTNDRQCYRVQATLTGPDGRPWAWIASTDDPRRLIKVPIDDLVPDCPH